MKTVFLSLLLVIIVSCSKSKKRTDSLLIIGEKDNLKGIWDITNSEWYIPNRYNEISFFSDGIFAFNKKGKWGFIDSTGVEIISAQYDDICPEREFFDGYTFVKKENKWIVINKEGIPVKKVEYDDIGLYKNNFREIIVNKKSGFVHANGEVFLPPFFDKLSSFCNGYAIGTIEKMNNDFIACIIDTTGNVNYCDSIYSKIFPFANGYSTAKLRSNKNMVIINSAGNIIHQLNDDKHRLIPLDESIGTCFILLKSDFYSTRFGLIKYDGSILIQPEYDEIIYGNSNLIFYYSKLKSKWGLADINGRFITEPIYESPTRFYEGASKVKSEGKYGLIDENGKLFINYEYDNIGSFKNELVIVSKNNKFGIINKQNNLIIPIIYDEIWPTETTGLYIFRDEEKCGVILPSNEVKYISSVYKLYSDLYY